MSNISVDFDVLNQRGSPAWFTDTFANIPTAGFVGRMFISKDTFAFYRDTGSGWDLIGGPGIGTLTGSGVVGQVSFFNGTQVLAGNNNLFWDNTNSRLGINTATPGAPLDIHGTGTQLQLNGTGANNSYLTFQNTGASKWRIGNLSPANSFEIYNAATSTYALTIASATNEVVIQQKLTIGGQVSFGSTLTNNTYTYTLPSATGTLALTSNITSAISGTTNKLAKFTSTNVIGNSMVSDDGTTLTSTGATRSNLYIKAVDNSYYGQLAFTNGTNASYGGISYNNSGQYMQFETNTSEWMRLGSTGNLLIGSTTDNGSKLQITGAVKATSSVQGSALAAIGTAANGVGDGPSMGVANTSNSYQIIQQLNGSYNLDFWSYRGSFTNISRIDGATGVYTPLSDINKKKDFELCAIGLNEILQLKPTLYRMKSDNELVPKQLGFIAQEVKNFIPQAYIEQDNFIGLNYNSITAALVKAIQELNQKLIRNNIN